MLAVRENVRERETTILTDDVDGMGDKTEHDSTLASHLTRVVAAVSILHVCIGLRHNDSIININCSSSSSSSILKINYFTSATTIDQTDYQGHI